MKVILSYFLIVIVALAGGHLASRERSAVAAAEFMPTTSIHVVVPQGTKILAAVKNNFSMSTQSGDSVRAFVTDPVMVNGSVAIPAGSRLDGKVEQIEKTKTQAEISLRFNSLSIGEKSWPIATEPVETTVTLESDFEILSNALGTVASAGIGVAIGAAGQTEDGVTAGMTAGAMRGAATVSEIKIVVTLAEPLDLIR